MPLLEILLILLDEVDDVSESSTIERTLTQIVDYLCFELEDYRLPLFCQI